METNIKDQFINHLEAQNIQLERKVKELEAENARLKDTIETMQMGDKLGDEIRKTGYIPLKPQ